MDKFSIKIPTKKYLKQYFTAIYGEKIELKRTSVFGDVILTKLTAGLLKNHDNKTVEQNLHNYDAELFLYLPIDYYYRVNQNSISPQILYSISRYLDNVFYEDLYYIVCVAKFFGVGVNTVIYNFMEKYNISQELIKVESLTRNYRRIEKKGTFKNFFLAAMSSPHSVLRLSDNSLYEKSEKKSLAGLSPAQFSMFG